MQEGVLRSAATLAKAQMQRAEKTPLAWKALAIALPALTFMTVLLKDHGEARAQNRLNFDRSAIVSADLAGVRASAQELMGTAPPDGGSTPGGAGKESPRDLVAATGVPTPTPPPPPTPRPRAIVAARERRPEPATSEARPSPAPQKECRKCELAKMGLEEPTEALADFGEEVAPPPEEAAKRLPLGTRIPVLLTQPVTTSIEGTPVTAEVLGDVVVGSRVMLAGGTRLEGLAFASQQDDRARVLFTTAAVDGHSVAIQGLALNQANEVGLEAKVLSKGSMGKRGGSAVLRALGSAATLGLAGRGGAALAPATYSLGSSVNSGLQNMTRDWQLSDKALRVATGTPAVVYLRAEAVIP